jgi:TolB-like protein/Tfp pilus assembly protein PilF
MQGEPASKSSPPTGAVFLSYASQDAQAARRVCDALRTAGIEVWFDQSELRGGDVWDQKIRREIHDCALFIPVISANTALRHEGYFRLEWDLADQRSHMMARSRVFVVPVCLDATTEAAADVPESFKRVQWTRLPAGEMPAAFVERVQRLLSSEPSTPTRVSGASRVIPAIDGRSSESWWSRRVLAMAALVAVLGATAYLAFEKPWISKPLVASSTPSSAAPSAAFAPPPRSIAVLPFVNLSGDKDQDYFSEGLTEELLNSLTAINDLQVAARTSSFSFQGEHPDIATVAHKLNVASVLEGSVRRSGPTLRISAQLINALTGFHLWSKSYDRDLGDVLKLQTEIATAVAEALKVTLLADVAEKIELGGTRNPAAFDAYLRASKTFQSRHNSANDVTVAIAAYTEAIRLDPSYALALAGRSVALTIYSSQEATGAAIREGFEKAERDARQAIAVAPDLARAHAAFAFVLESGLLDFARASDEYARALALAPGDSDVLRQSGFFAALMGHFDTAIAATRRAVVLDPLNRISHSFLGRALYRARRYAEAATAHTEAINLNPDFNAAYGERGLAYYGLGDFENARASCEAKRDYWGSQQCLAVVYDKLGRHAEAEGELRTMRSAFGEATAYQYATIYAQWGDRSKALEWLDTAMRLRDPGLGDLKTDPLMDPLRQEPRFRAIERELKFP